MAEFSLSFLEFPPQHLECVPFVVTLALRALPCRVEHGARLRCRRPSTKFSASLHRAGVRRLARVVAAGERELSSSAFT